MAHYPPGTPIGTSIVFHGYFSSCRLGPARLYVEIARLLSHLGITTYRFDCLGVGDSDGLFKEVTLESELRDQRTICGFVSADCRSTRVIAIGHSMGANLVVLNSHIRRFLSGAVLLAPDVDMRGGVDRLFTPDQLEELSKQGTTIRKGLPINASFISSLRKADIIAYARQLHTPTWVLQGTHDELYSAEGAAKLAAALPKGRFVPIQKGDHNFLVPSARVWLLEELERVVKNMLHEKPQATLGA